MSYPIVATIVAIIVDIVLFRKGPLVASVYILYRPQDVQCGRGGMVCIIPTTVADIRFDF